MRLRNTFLIVMLPLLTVSCQQSSSNTNSTGQTEMPSSVVERVDVDDFKARLADASKTYQLIDVRTPEEYSAGHIEGATNINFRDANFEAQIAALDKEIPVLVYCQAGGRSAKASTKFKAQGFKEIYDLKVGYGGWPKE